MNTSSTLSLAIMSGKGGVGKTNIALNLAFALYAMEYRALLMDCDLGLANLDVMLGIAPEGTLQDMLMGDADASSIIYSLADGFDILPAASGVPELVEMDSDMCDLLLRRMQPVLSHYDYVFLDLGAGINSTVQIFAGMAAARIVVVTPEPTALTDSYALIKVLATQHKVRDFLIVVNQVENRQEENTTFKRLFAACQRFLGVEPVLLGSIRTDKHVAEAVRRQTPYVNAFPDSPAAQDVIEIARKLNRIREAMTETLAKRNILQPLSS